MKTLTHNFTNDDCYYNTGNFPRFIVNHGNWDIYANEKNHCAAIPTLEAKLIGCRATNFGSSDYVRVTLGIKL